MRTSVLPARLAALAVGVALAGSLLASPATADDASTVSAAAAVSDSNVWPFLDEDDVQRMAVQACVGNDIAFTRWATPHIDDVQWSWSSDAEALLISAEVDRDGAVDSEGRTERDAVCTFATIQRGIAMDAVHDIWFDASYRLTAGSPVDADRTVEGPILAPGSTPAHPVSTFTLTTPPIFTDVDSFAHATLQSSGSLVTLAPGLRTVPGEPRSSATIARAKKTYDTKVAAAKKSYGKDKKKAAALKPKSRRAAAKAKAKRTYLGRIARYRSNYADQTATRPPSTQPGLVEVRTPYSLTSSID